MAWCFQRLWLDPCRDICRVLAASSGSNCPCQWEIVHVLWRQCRQNKMKMWSQTFTYIFLLRNNMHLCWAVLVSHLRQCNGAPVICTGSISVFPDVQQYKQAQDCKLMPCIFDQSTSQHSFTEIHNAEVCSALEKRANLFEIHRHANMQKS